MLFLIIFFNVFYLFLGQRETDMNGGGAEREGDTESDQAPGSEPSSQSPTRGATHGPRDRDLAEVGRLTDCATQAPLTCFFFLN